MVILIRFFLYPLGNCVHNCASFFSKNVSTCCYASYADGCFYTVCGKIKNQNQLSKRGPIVECTKFCVCNKSCPNRVIQHGTQVPLAIFKTDDGRGWGLKVCIVEIANESHCSLIKNSLSLKNRRSIRFRKTRSSVHIEVR